MIEKNFCRITGAEANHLLENTVATSRDGGRKTFQAGHGRQKSPLPLKVSHTLVAENVISGRIPAAFQLNALSCSLRAVKLSSKLNCPSCQPCVPNQYAKLPDVERQLQ